MVETGTVSSTFWTPDRLLSCCTGLLRRRGRYPGQIWRRRKVGEMTTYLGGGKHMNWREQKKRLLKDPEFRKEYEALEPEYKLASALIRLRLEKGLTQEQLAQLLNTKQESIARLESGGSLPSLSTVRKVADALDAEVEINLRPKHHAVKDGLATQSR